MKKKEAYDDDFTEEKPEDKKKPRVPTLDEVAFACWVQIREEKLDAERATKLIAAACEQWAAIQAKPLQKQIDEAAVEAKKREDRFVFQQQLLTKYGIDSRGHKLPTRNKQVGNEVARS